jgi:hypothetical protein
MLFDKNLSVNHNEACSFCNAPETGFTGPIQALNETTLAEAVVLGEKAGLDSQRLFDILPKTTVIALAHLGKLAKAVKHDYRPEFAIGLMNKDFRLILDTAAAVRAPMPTAAAAFPINNAEFAEHPDYAFCAVIDRMENLANFNSVRQGSQRETISSIKLRRGFYQP